MEFQKDAAVIWSYRDETLDQNVKAFCRRCNNEWMSALEVRAAKLLRPMLNAEVVGIKMGYTEQTTAASWAMKTAMVLQQMHPTESFIPIADYRDFHRRKQPSSNVFVLMGARHSSNGNMFEYKERFIGAPGRGIHHIHFAVGALYFGLAMFVGRARRYPAKYNEDAGTRANQIWPTCPRAIWPPPSITDVGGVEGMFDAFAHAYWGA